MQTGKRILTAMRALAVMPVTSDAFAGHGAGGSGKGQGFQAGSGTQQQSADRQRVKPQNGTFMSTGATGNCSTTLPGNGPGLQDGSGAGGGALTPVK